MGNDEDVALIRGENVSGNIGDGRAVSDGTARRQAHDGGGFRGERARDGSDFGVSDAHLVLAFLSGVVTWFSRAHPRGTKQVLERGYPLRRMEPVADSEKAGGDSERRGMTRDVYRLVRVGALEAGYRITGGAAANSGFKRLAVAGKHIRVEASRKTVYARPVGSLPAHDGLRGAGERTTQTDGGFGRKRDDLRGRKRL